MPRGVTFTFRKRKTGLSRIYMKQHNKGRLIMYHASADTNHVTLTGQVVESPVWSYRYRDEHFYLTHLLVKRLSSAADVLPLTIPGYLLVRPTDMKAGDRVTVKGQLRSYNRTTSQGGKLMLTVFVREFYPDDGPDDNQVTLQGTLCRPPVYRTTPLGRTISDLLIAVNRPGRHANYLPAIAWGEAAKTVSDWPVGRVIRLNGRFQSREYTKKSQEGTQLRVAYEVSVSRLLEPSPGKPRGEGSE